MKFHMKFSENIGILSYIIIIWQMFMLKLIMREILILCKHIWFIYVFNDSSINLIILLVYKSML